MLAEDDPVKQQMDIVDEQLDTTCRVFLGLTMGCARCHDHKFDPLAISDYYAMAGIFQSTRTMLSHRVDSKWNTTALGGPRQALRLEDLEQIIDRHDNALVNGNPARMSGEERSRPFHAARGSQEGIRDDPQGHDGCRGEGRRPRDLPARQSSDARCGRAASAADDPGRRRSARVRCQAERPARAGPMADQARETRSPRG